MYNDLIQFIRQIYQTKDYIPLHEPRFVGNEKKYVNECIDSTFVSSVGEFVNRFEKMIKEYMGVSFAVATVNGTSALHCALVVAGVQSNEEVILQPLTFVATANAIRYCNADPIFVDIDMDDLNLSPSKLEEFLIENTYQGDEGERRNINTGKKISACINMHTFGHPGKLIELQKICSDYDIRLIEDAAESVGSRYKNKNVGTFGDLAILSFNGNKVITTGGGGMIITDNKDYAIRSKHLTTQAKVSHPWEFIHDNVGYNYRLPNLNAALGCAQLENLDRFVKYKRDLAILYKDYFSSNELDFQNEADNTYSNYWLNAVLCKNIDERDELLSKTNDDGIMTRPAWNLVNTFKMYETCQSSDLTNSKNIVQRLVNIPSSIPIHWLA